QLQQARRDQTGGGDRPQERCPASGEGRGQLTPPRPPAPDQQGTGPRNSWDPPPREVGSPGPRRPDARPHKLMNVARAGAHRINRRNAEGEEMTNPLVSLRTKTSDFIAKRRENKADRGAGFIEYGEIVLLIAAIVGTVFGFGIDDKVKSMFQSGFDSISEDTGVEFQDGGGNDEDEETEEEEE